MTTQESISMDDSAIDRVMAEHDLSREEAMEIVDELQDGTDTPIICSQCGQYEDRDNGIAVGTFVLPDGTTATLDNECYAEIIEQETSLATRQSQVVADWIAGLKYSQIGSHLNISESNLANYKRQAFEKGAEAVDKIEQAQKTITIIEQLEEAER